MMPDQKIIANAMSGKTARACDCCVKRRARWYCPSDDAFLCQICDGSVHAANPLARRHERARLKTASLKRSSDTHTNNNLPSWHRGLTKKARTPRHAKNNKSNNNNISNKQGLNALPTVPELGADDPTSSQDDYETDDQLLYRVPVFDPLLDELCDSSTGTLNSSAPTEEIMKTESLMTDTSLPMDGYQPLDMDDFEFTADVESLLGKGLEEESYGIEELGLNVKNEIDSIKIGLFGVVEAGDDEDDELVREPFDLTFDYDDLPSSTYHDEVGIDSVIRKAEVSKVEVDNEKGSEMVCKKGKIMLRLDCEAISKAWATSSQRSPWINGQRPEINPSDFWPHYMHGTSGMDMNKQLLGDNQLGGILAGNGGIIGDGGREARVSRYREKRRTRLFSKKIRYEVRKLNAEKRPRMKGRFVKRGSSFVPTATAFSCFPNSTSKFQL